MRQQYHLGYDTIVRVLYVTNITNKCLTQGGQVKQ